MPWSRRRPQERLSTLVMPEIIAICVCVPQLQHERGEMFIRWWFSHVHEEGHKKLSFFFLSFYYYRLCFRPHMQLDATNGCWKRGKKKSWQLAMELHLRLNHTHNTTNVYFLIQLVFCHLPTFGITGHPCFCNLAFLVCIIAAHRCRCLRTCACSRCVPQPTYLVYQHWQTDWLGHSQVKLLHPTSTAPSTGPIHPFLLSCGWTLTQLIFGFTLVTNSIGLIYRPNIYR
jgi:hypothetical protein